MPKYLHNSILVNFPIIRGYSFLSGKLPLPRIFFFHEVLFLKKLHFPVGRYLNDVRTEGEGGGWPKCDDSTDRLREWDSDKGEGVQKSENYADVI